MRVRVHRVPVEEDEQGPAEQRAAEQRAAEQRAAEQMEDENVVLVVPVACSSRYLRDLTPAERAVAEGLLQGHSNAAIARSRGTRVRTVANQAASIFRRFGITSRSQLAAMVIGTSMDLPRNENE